MSYTIPSVMKLVQIHLHEKPDAGKILCDNAKKNISSAYH